MGKKVSIIRKAFKSSYKTLLSSMRTGANVRAGIAADEVTRTLLHVEGTYPNYYLMWGDREIKAYDNEDDAISAWYSARVIANGKLTKKYEHSFLFQLTHAL